MEAQKLRILVIGAHPDDCDMKAGGAAALYSALGHEVRFISVTNGESGHFAMSGRELADRSQGLALGQLSHGRSQARGHGVEGGPDTAGFGLADLRDSPVEVASGHRSGC